jgi:hypothetical protein
MVATGIVSDSFTNGGYLDRKFHWGRSGVRHHYTLSIEDADRFPSASTPDRAAVLAATAVVVFVIGHPAVIPRRARGQWISLPGPFGSRIGHRP